MFGKAQKKLTPLILGILQADQLAALGFFIGNHSELDHFFAQKINKNINDALTTTFHYYEQGYKALATHYPVDSIDGQFLSTLIPPTALSVAPALAARAEDYAKIYHQINELAETALTAMKQVADKKTSEAQTALEKIEPDWPFLLETMARLPQQVSHVQSVLLKDTNDKMTLKQSASLMAANAQKYAVQVAQDMQKNSLSVAHGATILFLKQGLTHTLSIKPQSSLEKKRQSVTVNRLKRAAKLITLAHKLSIKPHLAQEKAILFFKYAKICHRIKELTETTLAAIEQVTDKKTSETQTALEKIEPYWPFLLETMAQLSQQAPDVQSILLKDTNDKMTLKQSAGLMAANAQKYAVQVAQDMQKDSQSIAHGATILFLKQGLAHTLSIKPQSSLEKKRQSETVDHLKQTAKLIDLAHKLSTQPHLAWEKATLFFKEEVSFTYEIAALIFAVAVAFLALLFLSLVVIFNPLSLYKMYGKCQEIVSFIQNILSSVYSIEVCLEAAKKTNASAFFTVLAKNIGVFFSTYTSLLSVYKSIYVPLRTSSFVSLLASLFKFFCKTPATILLNTAKKSAVSVALIAAGQIEDTLRLPLTAITGKIAPHLISQEREQQREMAFYQKIRAASLQEEMESLLTGQQSAEKLLQLLPAEPAVECATKVITETDKSNENDVDKAISALPPRFFCHQEKNVLRVAALGTKLGLTDVQKIARHKLSLFQASALPQQQHTVDRITALQSHSKEQETPHSIACAA